MRGKAARESKPDPQRAPTPPVTTHRVYADAPDPGTASGMLPPFRPSAAAREIEREVAGEAGDPLDLDAVAMSDSDGLLDVGSEGVGEADERLEVALADVGEVSAIPELEDSADDEPNGDDESWDALGEALQVAVTRANPPFAEDLVRSADPKDRVVIEEPFEGSLGPGTQNDEARRAEVDVPGPITRPSGAKPQRDRFTEDLAATLESLAGSLRAQGFNALGDAVARGGRLESSLALFLAGYRAGRGE